MSAFASSLRRGFLGQLRALARARRHRLMLLLFLASATLAAGTYRRGVLRDLPVAVLDADGTGLSRAVVRALDATPELALAEPPASLEAARAALVRGDLVAVVLIPDGFTAAVKRGRQAEVLVAADLSNILSGKTAQRAVAKVLATVGAGAEVSLVEKLGTPPDRALARVLPIAVTESLADNPATSFAPYVAPGFAFFFLHVFTLFLSWSVLWPAAPERPLAETLGRFGAVLAVALAMGLVTAYAILGGVDGLWPATPAPLVAGTLLAFLAADALFAWALCAVFRNGLLGFQATVLLAMLSLMFSGLTWPWDVIPAPLRAVACAVPFTPFARALRLFLPGPASAADLLGPLAWLGAQAAASAAVVVLAALLERLPAWAERRTA
jgi:ABC-2 type transport system permease protein